MATGTIIKQIKDSNGDIHDIIDTTYSDATTSTAGLMSAEDKTKLDKIQDFYEVSVDLSRYTDQTSSSINLAGVIYDVSEFKIGDKIRIKSTLDFPTDQSPVQVRVYAPGFDIRIFTMTPDGLTSNLGSLGILRWSTGDDTDYLDALFMEYNNDYPHPNMSILKYGGFMDVIVIGIISGTPKQYICAPLFNNSCGYISTNVIDAKNASKAYISTSATSSSYPLVFTNNVTAGNKSLYTDSVNSLHYNPNSNTLTVPTASITTAKTSTIHVSTMRHPTAENSTNYVIQFKNPVKLYNYSNISGTFNVKGSDHESEGIAIYGGSTTSVATLVVNGINGNTTTRGNITCGKLTYTGGSLGTSDERLKDFENDIEIDFNKLKEIPKKYFTWKHDEDKVINIGTSAQEVEKIYPEIVGEYVDESTNIEYKSIDYSKLSIVALAAIDKLNERIEYLENKIKELEQA